MDSHQRRTIGGGADEGACEVTPPNQLGGPNCAYWTSRWPAYTGTCWGWMFSDIVMSVGQSWFKKNDRSGYETEEKLKDRPAGFMHFQVLHY